MTLKEVAKRAGVSISTVSRVINSGIEKSATSEVKERIWQSAKECGYTPNKTAQNLKKNSDKENKNQVKVSILFARGDDKPSDYFFFTLAEYVKHEAIKQGMLIGENYTIADTRNANLNIKIGKNDALIILGRAGMQYERFISQFGEKVIFITLNEMVINGDHVVSDGERAAEIAMSYLFDCGHKKIAYVGEYLDEVRYRGYKNFLIKHRLLSINDYVINATMTKEGGKKAVQYYERIKDKPTAIFCANDVTAMGLIEGLKDIGVKVPEDVSIISIDNINEAESFQIPLTTVNVPLKEMGSFAVKTLKDRTEKGHIVPLSIFMPSELVIRDSVKSR